MHIFFSVDPNDATTTSKFLDARLGKEPFSIYGNFRPRTENPDTLMVNFERFDRIVVDQLKITGTKMNEDFVLKCEYFDTKLFSLDIETFLWNTITDEGKSVFKKEKMIIFKGVSVTEFAKINISQLKQDYGNETDGYYFRIQFKPNVA